MQNYTVLQWTCAELECATTSGPPLSIHCGVHSTPTVLCITFPVSQLICSRWWVDLSPRGAPECFFMFLSFVLVQGLK